VIIASAPTPAAEWVCASDQHEGGCDGRHCIGGNPDDHYQTNQEGSFGLLEVGQELDPGHEIGFEPVMVVQGCPTAWRFR
jgi:hypothetical protein